MLIKYRTWKYKSGYLLILLFLFSISCRDGSTDIPSNSPGEGEVQIYLASIGPAETKAVESASEQSVKDVDLLVFKDDKYLYRREAYRNGTTGTYRSTLKIGERLTIYVIVNARNKILELESGVLTENNSWTEVRQALVLTTPAGLSLEGGLPMYGLLTDVSISGDIINELGGIKLLRAVASVDIVNSVLPGVFNLTEAYIYFAPDKGFIAPKETNLDRSGEGNIIVKNPESPGNMKATKDMRLHANTVVNQKLDYQLYLYENDATSATGSEKRFSRLIIGGSFEGGLITYYPVDFYGDDMKTVMPVIRNNKYEFEITGVSGPGFPDPDTAAEEFDSRMEVDVVKWDYDNEHEVIVDGPYFISLESKTAYLYRAAGTESTLSVTTNIDIDKITYDFVSPYGSVQKTETIIENVSYKVIKDERFQVIFLTNAENKIELIHFTALKNYDSTETIQLLKMKHSRVEFDITIEQLNKTAADWVDGGGVPSEIGKED